MGARSCIGFQTDTDRADRTDTRPVGYLVSAEHRGDVRDVADHWAMIGEEDSR